MKATEPQKLNPKSYRKKYYAHRGLTPVRGKRVPSYRKNQQENPAFWDKALAILWSR